MVTMYVPHERRSLILSLLEQRSYLRTAAVAQELGVTEETVRTDLIALQRQRLLQRVHGGARFIPHSVDRNDFSSVDSQYIRHILAHLPEHVCIYADDAPLLLHLLTHLGSLPCTLITPSLQVAEALRAPALTQQVILPGGYLDKETQLIRAEGGALRFLREHHPSLALLCPAAASSPQRISYRHALQAEWAQAASRAAQQTLLILRQEAVSNASAHSISCSPHLLIAAGDIPDSFLTIPHELVPVITIQDIRDAQET